MIELRDRTDRFARNVLAPLEESVGADELSSAEARQQTIQAAQAEGFYGMTQPASFGGTEAGQLALTVVRDTLGSHNLGFTSYVFGPGPGVLAGVTGDLRTTHLEPVLQGEKRGAFGFNAITLQFEDLGKVGVIDPTKVVRTALQNAASVAGMMLTTEAAVAEIPQEEEAAPAAPGGGMGGMGGMPGMGGMGGMGGMPGMGMPGMGGMGGMGGKKHGP